MINNPLFSKILVLLEEYNKIMTRIDDFRQTINTLADATVGSLRVGILDHTITEKGFSTVELISEFTRQVPNIELHLVQDIQSRLHRMIIDEQLDVAIGAFDTRNELISATKLYSEKQYLYCGRGHSLFNKTDAQIQTSDIESSNWISRGYQLDSFSQLPFRVNQYTATAANIESVLVLILTGKYLGYIPVHFAIKFEKQNKIRRLQPKKLSVTVDVSLIVKSRKRQTLAMKTFTEICKQVLLT
ncbi:MAG: substrate-binding domain-containing protein [Ostreibacterium sp.]